MLSVSVERIDRADLPRFQPEWRSVEAAAPDGSPFLTWDWLHAWVEVYAPSRLALVSARDAAGSTLAVGLLHGRRPDIWRFAGAPVSPERGLLCADGAAAEAWPALGRWLRDNPGLWRMLDTQGAPAPALELPGARGTSIVHLALELPPTFDEYLARFDAKKTRKRMRRLERASARIRRVPDSDLPDALRDLVRLHARRAASKGEHHPEVDVRLADLLERVAAGESVGLHAFELVVAEGRVGVTVRLDRGATTHSYNDGLDPAYMALSPGILLELESIRDAIEHGVVTYDLGPGDYQYKRDLGARPEARVSVEVAGAGMRGRLVTGTLAAYRSVRAGIRRAGAALRARRLGAVVDAAVLGTPGAVGL